MLSGSQRLKAGGIALAATPIVATLGRTWTWRVEGAHHYEALMQSGRAPILALWHGRILSATLYWRDRGIVALTSRNFDGEWIARLMARFGYRAARGSTSRGGAPALVQLRRELTAGHSVAFTVDGPRGPARVVQPGAVWLAGATRHPILPFHLEAKRFWLARSWDAAQIPKPFSTVAIAIGEPFEVQGTSHDLIEINRLELQQRLSLLERRSLQMLHEASSRSDRGEGGEERQVN
jgi:lysophospholipid acyltransferase (LPLAT)-like uncharacterized protein